MQNTENQMNNETHKNPKKMEQIKSKSYTLRDENGQWLGQIVITNDGLFASVTDYGNLSYAWRAYGENFREFLIRLNTGYFGNKLYTGMAYILSGKKCEKACQRYAEKILPPFQKALREEIAREKAEEDPQCEGNGVGPDLQGFDELRKEETK